MRIIHKISVIVPVYKVEKYLHRCIDSILSQSFTDFELILVDDGSPDNCGKICDEYAQKDSRVRVFHKPNGGVSSARNLGLDNARGEWVTFIDSDDYIECNYLSDLIFYQEQENVEFVAICNNINTHTNSTHVNLKKEEFDLLFSKFSFQKLCSPWGKLFNLNLIKHINLNFDSRIHLGEDIIFVLTYLLNINKLELIYSNKYFYEQREGSLTKTLNSYESELAGNNEFNRVINNLICQLNLSLSSIDALYIWQLIFTERVINAIHKLPNRKDRLNKLANMDLTIYNKYKKSTSWKEKILVYLLKHKMFSLYDILINSKNK